jgi:GWxTD domain-containing protein
MRLLSQKRNLIFALMLPFLLDAHVALAGKLFTMDAASFRQRGGLVYQEVYFMIQRDRLKFEQTVEGYEAQYRIAVELHSPDTLLSSTSWEMVDRALQLEDITPRQKLPDVVVFNLAPGRYTVKGIVTDLNRNTMHESELELDLAAYNEDQLSLSDIEFAMKLQKGDEGSKFYKNGFLVIPNPERMYGTSMPMLYYYSEIYNLVTGQGEYRVERLLLNDAREVINVLPQKTKKKAGSSVVEIDGFSVASLFSGTYYLQLVARDMDSNAADTAEAKFFVYREEDFSGSASAAGAVGQSTLAAEINSYSEEELQQAVEEIKYFTTDAEWSIIGGLNTEGKKQYLIRFYEQRDPDPTTPVNEFQRIIVERKEYANKKFGIWDKPGWRTNRGRVYMLYGSPDDIEYHTHDPSTRAYQIWYYDSIEGGVQFVFVDRNNFGDYWLVHSNKQGELYRPNWFEEEALVRRP